MLIWLKLKDLIASFFHTFQKTLFREIIPLESFGLLKEAVSYKPLEGMSACPVALKLDSTYQKHLIL